MTRHGGGLAIHFEKQFGMANFEEIGINPLMAGDATIRAVIEDCKIAESIDQFLRTQKIFARVRADVVAG
jgi:hypothetical protein